MLLHRVQHSQEVCMQPLPRCPRRLLQLRCRCSLCSCQGGSHPPCDARRGSRPLRLHCNLQGGKAVGRGKVEKGYSHD